LDPIEGKTLPGTWTLEVTDNANRDQGAILSFAVELAL
jgi:subtilisin-like proprotein convertase family protein